MMKSRRLINSVLLLLLVGLASLVWLKPGVDEKQVEKISQLDSESVKKITINRAQNSDRTSQIILEKKDKQWVMTSPYSATIAKPKISLLLTLLNEPVKSSYPAQGKDLKQFKLHNEDVSIQFNNESKIIFGMSHPVNQDRYLLRDDNILLISETVYGALTSDIASFFTTHLLPKNTQVTKIELPDAYQVADDTAAKWQLANAIQVFDWDSTSQPSQGRVTIHLSNNEKIVYEIVETQPELMLVNSKLNAKYQISSEIAPSLLPERSKTH